MSLIVRGGRKQFGAGLAWPAPAVCRRCYVHPDVLAAHAEGSLHRLRPGDGGAQAGAAGGLSGEERAVLRLLRSRGDAPARRRRAAGPVRGGSATGR